MELLGRGGMGEVWRAYDTATNRTVAIKLLPPHLASDSTFVQRFRREAQAAAQLSNPHIIPIHTYGEIDGRLYVDMRLVEGRDLQAVLGGGPLEPGRAVRIIEQVAKALQAAHRIGLVHRDVKPSNVLLDQDDFAYLIDFGIARGADQTRMTGTGTMIGSFHYMAPERFRAREADARADIYALACVLYECLTGTPPFPGDSMESQIAAHLTDPPPQPSTTQPSVPADFDAVIAKGMAKDPDNRYATVDEFAGAAQDAITAPIAQPVPAPITRPGTYVAPQASQPTPPAVGRHVAPPGAMARDAAAPLRYTAADRASALGPRKELAKPVAPQAETSSRPRWWRRRTINIVVTLVVLVVLAGLAIGRWAIRNNYYVAEYSGKVSIVRGIQGSLLGISLHEPYLVACLNARNELSLISYGQSGSHLDCQLMTLQDLSPAGQAQVQAGLPGGTLDQAESQLRKLLAASLLDCPPPGPSTAATTSQTVPAIPHCPAVA
jgi:Protein kinase domain